MKGAAAFTFAAALVFQTTIDLDLPNAAAALVTHPALAKAVLDYDRYVSGASTLSPHEREVLALRTAWLTRSNYLWAHHAPRARRAGMALDTDLARVAEGPDAQGLDPFDRTLIRAADELHVDSFISDRTWAALSARYDINQLVDVIDSVGHWTLEAGAFNSLNVEIEPGHVDRLPAN